MFFVPPVLEGAGASRGRSALSLRNPSLRAQFPQPEVFLLSSTCQLFIQLESKLMIHKIVTQPADISWSMDCGWLTLSTRYSDTP